MTAPQEFVLAAPLARRPWRPSPSAIVLSLTLAVLILAAVGVAMRVLSQIALIEALERVEAIDVKLESVRPDWIRSWMPDEWLQGIDRIDSVRANYSHTVRVGTVVRSFGDADLLSLRGRSDLRDLHLHSTQVTDKGLAVLGTLPNLSRLHLAPDDLVTDEGLKSLVVFRASRRLNSAEGD